MSQLPRDMWYRLLQFFGCWWWCQRGSSKHAAYFAVKIQAASLRRCYMTENDDDTLTPESSPHPHPFIRWECSGLMVLFKPATAVKTSSTNAVMPGVNLGAGLYRCMTPILSQSSPVGLKLIHQPGPGDLTGHSSLRTQTSVSLLDQRCGVEANGSLKERIQKRS